MHQWTSNGWSQVGSVITDVSGADGDYFGETISLDGSGSILVVGAQGKTPGKAQIYKFDNSISEYVQKGDDLGPFEGNTLCGAVR